MDQTQSEDIQSPLRLPSKPSSVLLSEIHAKSQPQQPDVSNRPIFFGYTASPTLSSHRFDQMPPKSRLITNSSGELFAITPLSVRSPNTQIFSPFKQTGIPNPSICTPEKRNKPHNLKIDIPNRTHNRNVSFMSFPRIKTTTCDTWRTRDYEILRLIVADGALLKDVPTIFNQLRPSMFHDFEVLLSFLEVAYRSQHNHLVFKRKRIGSQISDTETDLPTYSSALYPHNTFLNSITAIQDPGQTQIHGPPRVGTLPVPVQQYHQESPGSITGTGSGSPIVIEDQAPTSYLQECLGNFNGQWPSEQGHVALTSEKTGAEPHLLNNDDSTNLWVSPSAPPAAKETDVPPPPEVHGQQHALPPNGVVHTSESRLMCTNSINHPPEPVLLPPVLNQFPPSSPILEGACPEPQHLLPVAPLSKRKPRRRRRKAKEIPPVAKSRKSMDKNGPIPVLEPPKDVAKFTPEEDEYLFRCLERTHSTAADVAAELANMGRRRSVQDIQKRFIQLQLANQEFYRGLNQRAAYSYNGRLHIDPSTVSFTTSLPLRQRSRRSRNKRRKGGAISNLY